MKIFRKRRLTPLWLALAWCGVAGAQTSQTNLAATSGADEKAAWKEFQKASTPLPTPADWQMKRPGQDQVQAFHKVQAAHAAEAADQAKDFYKKFPQSPNAALAKDKEFQLTEIAVQLGDTNKISALQALEEKRLKDPNLDEDERFRIKLQSIQMRVMTKMNEHGPGLAEVEEKGAHELIKDFPKRDEGYQLLLQAAGETKDPKEAKRITDEIASSDAPKDVKAGATGLLRKMEALGKPVNIKFTSTDNREVDFAKLKGKVVLLDFWATWCGPCVAEIPEVKETYKKLHPKGFEIVGISLDSDKSKLEQFVAKEEMPWAQYFDGKGWQNKLAQEYGIQAIPAMWLVDKKGNVRDLNARGGLAEKVEQMLGE
jgi:thiol-disulfide isomerase/thioredoxin